MRVPVHYSPVVMALQGQKDRAIVGRVSSFSSKMRGPFVQTGFSITEMDIIEPRAAYWRDIAANAYPIAPSIKIDLSPGELVLPIIVIDNMLVVQWAEPVPLLSYHMNLTGTVGVLTLVIMGAPEVSAQAEIEEP